MIILLKGKTTLPEIGIAKMDVLMPNGDTITVDSDLGTSEIEDGVLRTKMEEIVFDEEPADGRISELKGGKVAVVYFYQVDDNIGDPDLKDPNVIQLTSVEIEDEDDILQITVDVQPKFVFVV